LFGKREREIVSDRERKGLKDVFIVWTASGIIAECQSGLGNI
jgi:hypothetical protein